MRTWERVLPKGGGQPYWQEVTTDDAGFDDAVWVVTLCQCLLLNLGESPFYANYGIPAQQSIMTQIAPDFYVTQTQRQFAQYFASLIIVKLLVPLGSSPTYRVNVVTERGAKLTGLVSGPVPG